MKDGFCAIDAHHAKIWFHRTRSYAKRLSLLLEQIFHDHWDEFKQFNPRYDTAYYDELVNKMLACGNPEQIGYLDYRCLDCGQGKHLVAMSCKSALCLRCAKVYVDDFVSHLSHNLHEGVIY